MSQSNGSLDPLYKRLYRSTWKQRWAWWKREGIYYALIFAIFAGFLAIVIFAIFFKLLQVAALMKWIYT